MDYNETYTIGLDVLGAGLGVGDFVPWLNVVGKVVGGLVGGGDDSAKTAVAQKEAIEKALAQERLRQQAEAEAAKTRMLLYGVIGMLGIGGIVLLLNRRK